eukprot:CAMPEP_0176159282 /NCGR_PEP_ID=MMETSP0120_2-20121206/81480_1 /TAXON_ID=160619 /ORGANISM="Kryptoperidinium foliaceum, Strain CCMP 1326" /LENGTH=322 /DNA_ID=CAMNT_0017496693 /DNA_START=77 /DNA_END=1041 /DNA_ORIENTATION=-
MRKNGDIFADQLPRQIPTSLVVTRKAKTKCTKLRHILLLLVLVAAQVPFVSCRSASVPSVAADLCTAKPDADHERSYPPINEFLSDEDRKKGLKQFHVHGWRWHTASLVRESGRLCNLAQRARRAILEGNDVESMTNALQKAADYVVGFNMKGLHRIEADLMFPWMRDKLTSAAEVPQETTKAFADAMSQLESDRKKLEEFGDFIKTSVNVATDAAADNTKRSEAIGKVAEASALLQSYARSMMNVEDNFLVPAIAKLVPESEQHSFNNRVLRNLGILDSRLHLVAMYEAIEESGDVDEKALFEKAIPSIPQMMIPRWKRKL